MGNADKTRKKFSIKIDFNLLNGIWVLEKKGHHELYRFEKEIGSNGKFIIYNALDLPSPIDSKVLDYLMMKSQEKDWTKEVTINSLREIAREVGMGTDKKRLNRIKRSFEILVNTRIRFENCFIDSGTLEHIEGGSYEVVNIGVLSDYVIERVEKGKPNRITAWFNDNFLALCKHSLGYKLVPFSPIRGLRDTAYALYKWSWRWFNAEQGYGERWIGNGENLVKWYRNELNSIAKYKYPSEVLRRVKSAIKQINDNIEIPFYLQLKKEKESYKIEIYRKDQHSLKKDIPFDRLPKLLKDAVISLIKRKKNIKEPYALARSMSWKEIDNLLQRVVIIPIYQDIWNTIQEFTSKFRKIEQEDFNNTVLASVAKDDEKLFIAADKSRLKEKHVLYDMLETFLPNWRKSIHEAIGYTKEERWKNKTFVRECP